MCCGHSITNVKDKILDLTIPLFHIITSYDEKVFKPRYVMLQQMGICEIVEAEEKNHDLMISFLL